MKKLIIFYTIFFSFTYVNGSDFGTTGIIDIPSARMLRDGVIRTTFSSQKISNITNITFQATPWLQTTFRYTIFNPKSDFRSSIPGVIDGLNDRSYSAKITILNEKEYLPEIAIGIKDLIGTGAWSSEYIVSSKKINNFDLSVGLGWGRLAERDVFQNPFVKINDMFSERKYSGGNQGGKVNLKQLFRGENVGLFAGLRYKIPNTNITILGEYNSDSYQREISYKTISNSSPLSYGIEWNLDNNLDLSLSYQQGNQIGLSISSLLDAKSPIREYLSEPFFSAIDGYKKSAAPENLDLILS